MIDLNEKDFIRYKLFYGNKSLLAQYQELTSGSDSLVFHVKYELFTSLFGPFPGAVGYLFRKLYYPSLFKSCGRNVIWGQNITIRHPRKIVLGDHVIIDDYALLDARGAPKNGFVIGNNTIIGRGVVVQSKVGPITIGPNCNIGSRSTIVSQGGISIGEWTQIAGDCKISGGLFKPDPTSETPFPFSRYSKGPIIIGPRCFIGGSVQIIDGVQIGIGSMIGTGSVIMSNIPEFSIYMPKPGMVIGKTV
jgi:acetyltransferase-like isoleucine patch superfamily enzyme